jgi:hypothetical protein
MSQAVANSPVFWGLLLGGLAAGYALPTIIALIRHVESIATVLILNLFPLSWPAALMMTCTLSCRDDWPPCA